MEQLDELLLDGDLCHYVNLIRMFFNLLNATFQIKHSIRFQEKER